MSAHLIHRSTERLPDAGEHALDEVGVSAAMEQGELVHRDGCGAVERDGEHAGAFWQGEVVISAEQQGRSVEVATQKFDAIHWKDFLTKLAVGDNAQAHSKFPLWSAVVA